MKTKIYNNLPQKIKTILLVSEGWLVGNAFNAIVNTEEPKDYDIIVPSREKFQLMTSLIDADDSFSLTINSYGGLKFNSHDEGVASIDIWCESLDHFLLNANKISYIYNMKRNILLENK